MLYRTKPVEVDAERYPGHHPDTVDALIAFEEWFKAHGGIGLYKGQHLHIVDHIENVQVADPGDWIVWFGNRFHVCKREEFDTNYERVVKNG